MIAVRVGGQARAYPEQILVWHEIVNDTLGGRPIAVTYCPLCNSAIAFDRRVGGRKLTFGTTGKLRNSDLVMWDRQTQSWWQQFSGTALVGRYTGARLRPLDSQVLGWAQFKAAYPHGAVLSRRTGFDRRYGTNPYVGYDAVPTTRPTLLAGGLTHACRRWSASWRYSPPPGRGRAVHEARSRALVTGAIANTPLVVLFAPGVVSALDESAIARSRDVGTAGAFDRRVGGRLLRLVAVGRGRFRDQIGSTWDVTGRALTGPLRGTHLRGLRHDEQFWFALAAFLPQATLLR